MSGDLPANVSAVRLRMYHSDLVQVGVYVDALRKAQVLIGYEGWRAEDGAQMFTGETNFAIVDKATGRPVCVPAGIHRALERCPGMLRRR